MFFPPRSIQHPFPHPTLRVDEQVLINSFDFCRRLRVPLVIWDADERWNQAFDFCNNDSFLFFFFLDFQKKSLARISEKSNTRSEKVTHISDNGAPDLALARSAWMSVWGPNETCRGAKNVPKIRFADDYNLQGLVNWKSNMRNEKSNMRKNPWWSKKSSVQKSKHCWNAVMCEYGRATFSVVLTQHILTLVLLDDFCLCQHNIQQYIWSICFSIGHNDHFCCFIDVWELSCAEVQTRTNLLGLSCNCTRLFGTGDTSL